MLPVLMILFCNGFPYIDGKVNDKNSLKFAVVPPESVTFVRGNEDNKCEKRKHTQSKTEPLHCEVNQKANITWQACHSFNRDVMSEENFLKCPELFQNEGRYCRNISRKRDSYYAVVTIGTLVGNATEEPHKGCFRCIAQVGNQKINASGDYTYLDQCGTPTRYEAINPLKICIRNDFFCQSKEKECKMLPPEDVRVIQNLTTDGKADLILQWKEAKSKGFLAGIYGYKIYFFDDTGGPHCYRLITKYDKKPWFKDGKYHFSITENIGYRSYKERIPYRFTLQSLPTSKIITKTIKMNFSELCENYTKTYNHTPTKCLMVTGIKLVSCIPERSVTLVWNTTGLPSTVSKILIWYFSIGGRELYQLSTNVTSYTFTDVSKYSKVLIGLKVGKQYTYYSRLIKLTCKVDPLVPDAEHRTHDYTQIGLITLFSVCLLIIIVILVVYRIDKCSLLPLRIHYYNQFSTTPSMGNEQEAIKVMLVYPEGCAEVEKLICYIGNLLRTLGIDVSADIFQEKRVADYGVTNTLVNDFKDANYVVVLCVGPQGTEDTEVVHTRNYDFVMKSLLLPTYSDDNGKRFIAVSLSKCNDLFPPYLKERSYVLSSDLEYFLQHVLHGIQTTCTSSIFREACRDKLENIDRIKKELRNIDKVINAETHDRCYRDYCRKGTKGSASQFSSKSSLMEGRLDGSRNSFVSIVIFPEKEFVENKHDECNSSEKLLK